GDNPDAPDTINPVAFNAFTLMVKDATQYAADGGWAYGNWATPQLNAAAADFDRACVDCHTSNVADNDFVFTIPGAVPDALFGG
ncbi:MAG TPA: cytochrome P460 family protein, partial [Polyangiaceae bacterium]|nr:cytochrome P460 family protein [Polyangiaceae bacterium]